MPLSGFSQNLLVPAFAVHLAADQTAIPTATFTKILFDVEEIDNNSNFASNRFTVTIPGKYFINLRATFLTVTDTKIVSCAIYKNGSLAEFCTNVAGATNDVSAFVFGMFDCVATDYFEGYCYHENGSNRDLRGTIVYSKMVGWRVGL